MSDPSSRADYDRERHRFHTRLVRPAVVRAAPLSQPVPRIDAPASPMPVVRYLKAAMAGLAAAMATLAPPRCRGCRAVITSGDDTYCVSCGTPLLTGG